MRYVCGIPDSSDNVSPTTTSLDGADDNVTSHGSEPDTLEISTFSLKVPIVVAIRACSLLDDSDWLLDVLSPIVLELDELDEDDVDELDEDEDEDVDDDDSDCDDGVEQEDDELLLPDCDEHDEELEVDDEDVS